MAKKRDHHAKGQKDQVKSRGRGFVDLIGDAIFGGPHDPPKSKADKDSYNSGWKNAKKNRPKR